MKLSLKAVFLSLVAATLIIGASFAAINFAHQNKPLPDESATAVVEKFYEYISEAKIRGGSLLINEAYKLTSGAGSRTDRALFLGIINRYPPGFKVDIVDTKIQDRHAVVMIEYQMPSSFGDIYTLRAPVHLNVDEQSDSWRLDFRGDTDDQDRETIAKSMQLKKFDPETGRNVSKDEKR